MKMTLGQRLKKLRNDKKWTLKEVAEKLNLSGHSTYSNWEYGRTEPDVEMLKAISKLFDVNIEYLIYGTKEHIATNEKVYNLKEILTFQKLTWGNKIISQEEKQKALELLNGLWK